MTRTVILAIVLATACGVSPSQRARASDTDSIYASLKLMQDRLALYVAVEEARAAERLKTEGPYTLFAPSDAAFKKLAAADIKKIATNKDAVRKLVAAHMVEGVFTTKELAEYDGKELPTLSGAKLKVERVKDDTFRVGGATITSADRRCSNGVIHLVDAVLLPK